MSKNQLMVSKAITSPAYQKKMMEVLQDEKRVKDLTTAISGALAVNADLNSCEPSSVLSCAIIGAGLNLVPTPQLGRYYMVPYTKDKGKATETKLATFILGYKGYLELAKRTGNYKYISVASLKQGELKSFDALTGEYDIEFFEDEEEREKLETTGYIAVFEELTGFKKAIYWSKNKMLTHADKYSPAFAKNATSNKVSYTDYLENKYPSKDSWKYSSFWYKNFDDMAQKTMLRQLISRWGNMSTELEKAFNEDSKVVNVDGTTEYIDVVDYEEITDPFQETVKEVNIDEVK